MSSRERVNYQTSSIFSLQYPRVSYISDCFWFSFSSSESLKIPFVIAHATIKYTPGTIFIRFSTVDVVKRRTNRTRSNFRTVPSE